MNRKPYLIAVIGLAVLSIQALASPNGLAFPQPDHHSNSTITAISRP